MAVQAQYSSDAFSPDFLNRARKSAMDDLHMMQDHRRSFLQPYSGLDLVERPIPASLAGALPLVPWCNGIADWNCCGEVAWKQHHHHQALNNATVFSGPQSELTCNNASGSRKRAREESMPLFPRPPNFVVASVKPTGITNISTVLPQSRLLDSAATSTSGRLASPSQTVTPLSRDLVSLLYQQNAEIDALVRLQTKMMRTGLEEARKRHCQALLTAWEQQVGKRLMEKEAELERAKQRNAELEEKVRQMSEENQIWFGMARNNEAIVCSLRESLEQALLPQDDAGGGREGYGDSNGAPLPADEVQSCCFEVEDFSMPPAEEAEGARRQRACKACGERDVCVLLLPCRHLCLCKDCEPDAGACPVCGSCKNACLQVFMC